MLDEKTDSGEWWLPSNPDERIKGKLTFNQSSGAILELDKPFTKPFKTIYGLSPWGREITLLDCIPLSINLPSLPYKILAHFTFLGAHFKNSEDAIFNSFHCQISNLFEWIGNSGVKTEGEFTNNILIRYDNPEPISISINPELKIEIIFQSSFSSRYGNREIQLKQIAQISFHPKENKNIDEYINWMHHFRNFLCLVTQESIFPQKIIGLREDAPTSMIDILYKLDTPSNTESNIYNSLFTYNDIENKFETYLQNWYRIYDDLEPVFTLYFGTHYGQFVYLNLRFLCLVQAIEAYHRRLISNEELPKDKHKERINSIFTTAPLEYKKWLQNKLTYSNEPSLRSRLKYICEMLSELYLITDKKDFINKVINTRNYMTHYDLDLKDKSVDGKELFIITEKLKMIVEICILKEIGLSLEEIYNLTRQKYVQKLQRYN